MKHNITRIALCLLMCSIASHQTHAQLFKKKKKESAVQAFAPGEASPQQKQRQMVSPVRQFLNKFNLQLEKSIGYFSYQNELTDVSIVRNPRGDQLFIVPLGEEGNGVGPFNAYSNWFSDLDPHDVYRIDDDAQIVRTDTASFVYKNNGRINPWTLRLSFSFKQIDKNHLKRTGERIPSDKELFRLGVGISAGSLKFRNTVNYQEVDDRIGNFELPQTKISTTKLFGSLTYNAYTFIDFSVMPDVSAGVWKTNKSALNQELVTYDPFFNIGIILEKQISKYFKLYMRPSFEVRKYTLTNDVLAVSHSYNIFSLDLGMLIKYPTYPRNKHGANRVQMEHVFNGRIYRGRSIFQPQNPRTGQFGQSRKKRVKYGQGND